MALTFPGYSGLSPLFLPAWEACQISKAQRGISMDDFHNVKFFEFQILAFWHPFVSVAVWVSLWQHPKGYRNGWVPKWQLFFEF